MSIGSMSAVSEMRTSCQEDLKKTLATKLKLDEKIIGLFVHSQGAFQKADFKSRVKAASDLR